MPLPFDKAVMAKWPSLGPASDADKRVFPHGGIVVETIMSDGPMAFSALNSLSTGQLGALKRMLEVDHIGAIKACENILETRAIDFAVRRHQDKAETTRT